MNSNFTSTVFGDHRRLVVAETKFKFVTCGSNILHIAFLARNQPREAFWCAQLCTLNLMDSTKGASLIPGIGFATINTILLLYFI